MWSVKSETVGAFGAFDPSKLNLERLNLLNTVEPRIAVQNNRFKFLRE